MSVLKLRLDNWLEGEELSGGAVVNLYPITPQGTSSPQRRSPFAIPAGSGNNFYTLEAAPGRYLIEAQLPSGDVVNQEVTLDDSSAPLEVRLKSDRSPHEWLSWQQFSGKVAERGRYNREEASPSSSVPCLSSGTFASPFTDPLNQAWQWEALAGAVRNRETHFPWLVQKPPLTARNYDGRVQSYVLTATMLGLPWQPPPRGTPALEKGRALLVMRFDPEVELISLPLPWITLDQSREGLLDIAVRSVLDNPQSPRTTLTVRDPSIGSALSYMTAGSLDRACLLFDSAREMLFDKQMNPLAAAAGAYVLVSTQQGADRQNWHAWVKNLMDWYPWLPDGAIQYGRMKIRDEDSDSDIDEARDVLFKAYARGLPYFSAGIRWLLNGLTIFADDGDEEARAYAANVHKVALRADMSQPFTVIRLGPRAPVR